MFFRHCCIHCFSYFKWSISIVISDSHISKTVFIYENFTRLAIFMEQICLFTQHLRIRPNCNFCMFCYRGYITDSEETYHIDPLNGTLHRVFRNSDRKKLPFQCGMYIYKNVVLSLSDSITLPTLDHNTS